MNSPNQPQDPKDVVLARIRAGELSMRPKAYFIAQTIAVAGVALAVLFLSVCIASFMFFVIRINGMDALLSFGIRGIGAFFHLFPWHLLVLDGVLLILLEWLLHRFQFAYSRPVLYLLLAAAIIVGTAGFAFEETTDIHDGLLERAERQELPLVLQGAYEEAYEESHDGLGVYYGIVTSRTEAGFIMNNDDFDGDEDDGTWIVLVPDAFGGVRIEVEDTVLVAGEREEAVIRAYGIRVLNR